MLFVIFGLPLLALSIWFGIRVHWGGYYIMGLVILNQFVFIVPIPSMLVGLFDELLDLDG